MADRLISADALQEWIRNYLSVFKKYDWRDILQIIRIQPVVDAEPVRHGQWIPQITDLGTMVFCCSACQRISDIHWAYCPRCGAKMDGRREDNE